MKLVSTQQTGSLEGELRRRFSEFNRSSSSPKGRKYPPELQVLATQALKAGMKPAELKRLTGAAGSTVHRWAHAEVTQAAPKPTVTVADPRRLEVVAGAPAKGSDRVVVRLPSGVTIETAELSGELLVKLAGLEVGHASSR